MAKVETDTRLESSISPEDPLLIKGLTPDESELVDWRFSLSKDNQVVDEEEETQPPHNKCRKQFEFRVSIDRLVGYYSELAPGGEVQIVREIPLTENRVLMKDSFILDLLRRDSSQMATFVRLLFAELSLPLLEEGDDPVQDLTSLLMEQDARGNGCRGVCLHIAMRQAYMVHPAISHFVLPHDAAANLPPDSDGCPVCLESFYPGPLLTSLPCSHAFHLNCINSWFNKANSCPLCRLTLLEPPQPQPPL